MFSYHGSGCPQRGQRERGLTMLMSFGTLAITTLRKLPTIKPRTARPAANNISIGEAKVLNANTSDAERASRQRAICC